MSARWRNPTLVGDRVTLRPIVAGDAVAMWEQVNHPEGLDLTATTARFTREQIAAWCAGRAEQDERLDLAIVEHASGAWASEAVLNEYDDERNSANLRISLRGPDWYGRGLGTEATRLLVDHGLCAVGLDRITLEVLARNSRARRAYEKLGFREVGRHTEDGEEWFEMAVARSHLSPDYPLLPERLLLRPVSPERVLLAIHSYRSREDVCRFVPFTPGTTEELFLVVERRDTGELIGDLVLFWHRATDRHAEIGYVIHPDHSGLGLAAEAAGALLALAFDGLGAHRVTARLDERNTPSAMVVERLGMRREATFVEGEWFKGEWTTLLVYAMLRREWEACRDHEWAGNDQHSVYVSHSVMQSEERS